jgi:DNA-binding MarR family transcriptional regulator
MPARPTRAKRAPSPAPSPEALEPDRAAAEFVLSEKPGFLFRRLDTRATLLYHKHTGQTDITPRQLGVLVTLFQNGRMTQAELSKAVFTDKSTLGEMIQRMVERGLVRRRIPKNDRRTAELWLSETGSRFVIGSVRPTDAAQEELLAPLPAEYRALFLKCLRILADAQVGESD